MGAVIGWFATIIAVLGLVMALHHLGVDIASAIGGVARNVEGFLNTPVVNL